MGNNLDAMTVVFTEFYYWVTIVLMFLIHVGFCVYEVGVSRRRNHQHTLMKNIMALPLVTVTFFLFGWWIYFAFQNGPFITGDLISAPHAEPWNPLMATHLSGATPAGGVTAEQAALWHRLNGVFWAAFLLFSWTAASIVSGAVIERIRSGAFWVLAVVIGSFAWIIDASWGWSSQGWMVKLLGYHDAYASGVIHAIAGGFALGVLIVLGPRIGKFRADGTPREIPPHNPWLVTVGIFLIYTGFWGFYAACNVPIISPAAIAGQITGDTWTATNIYLTPTTLSAITFNFLMSLSGGLLMAYAVSKGDPFWTFSGGLAGLICASAGNDLYHPIQAMFIGAIGALIAYKMHYFVERRFKIDDAVGAVATRSGLRPKRPSGTRLTAEPPRATSAHKASGVLAWGKRVATPQTAMGQDGRVFDIEVRVLSERRLGGAWGSAHEARWAAPHPRAVGLLLLLRLAGGGGHGAV